MFKAHLKQRDSQELKHTDEKIIGHASRGKEERSSIPKNVINTQNKQKLSRRQRRAQERKMKR